MTKRLTNGQAAIAGAIGSAAVAAAMLYVNRRKEKAKEAENTTVPSGEPPETD